MTIKKSLVIKVTMMFLMTLLINGASAQQHENYKKMEVGLVHFASQNLTLKVEIAETEMQRRIGLMFRTALAKKHGMLFVFSEKDYHQVWMKNTLIPLDAIFLSEQGEIVSVIEAMEPCDKAPCRVYTASEPAKYMLEVHSGFINEQQVEKGQKVLLKSQNW